MCGVETKTTADIIKKLCVNNNPLSQARPYNNLERRNFQIALNLKYRLQMTVITIMQVAVLHHINALDTGLQIYIEKKTCIKMLVIWD